MNVTIKINCDNAYFEGEEAFQVATILRGQAERLIEHDSICVGESWPIMDGNGNRVGELKVTR